MSQPAWTRPAGRACTRDLPLVTTEGPRRLTMTSCFGNNLAHYGEFRIASEVVWGVRCGATFAFLVGSFQARRNRPVAAKVSALSNARSARLLVLQGFPIPFARRNPCRVRSHPDPFHPLMIPINGDGARRGAEAARCRRSTIPDGVRRRYAG